MGLTIKFAKNFPAFGRLFIDDENRIFAETYERTKEEEVYFDVFDSNGRYIYKVPLKPGRKNCIWKKNKLYTIDETEEGFPVVKRYKVVKEDFK